MRNHCFGFFQLNNAGYWLDFVLYLVWGIFFVVVFCFGLVWFWGVFSLCGFFLFVCLLNEHEALHRLPAPGLDSNSAPLHQVSTYLTYVCFSELEWPQGQNHRVTESRDQQGGREWSCVTPLPLHNYSHPCRQNKVVDLAFDQYISLLFPHALDQHIFRSKAMTKFSWTFPSRGSEADSTNPFKWTSDWQWFQLDHFADKIRKSSCLIKTSPSEARQQNFIFIPVLAPNLCIEETSEEQLSL